MTTFEDYLTESHSDVDKITILKLLLGLGLKEAKDLVVADNKKVTAAIDAAASSLKTALK